MTSPRHLLAYTLLAAGLGLLAFRAIAGGEVYKWTDSKGNVHYEDRNTGNAAVKLPIRVPPPDPASVAELQVVRNGEASDVYVNTRLGGPIEVSLMLTEARNVIADPAMPLRQLLPARSRVLVSRIYPGGTGEPASYAVGMSAMPGDPTAVPANVVYNLPMDESSPWEVGQGFHGGFSHSDEQNRYAVDLIVPVGTPVLAARDGVVMQVESAFDKAGLNQQKFSDRANVVRILHDDGSMAVYAHLQENAVYVRVGERVGVGHELALSGNTGFTSGPHLHFCVQVNKGMRLVSVPFRMVTARGFLAMPRGK
jgi:murein DD-endopeptidase MepM/ murein hydrolase activator NlpD